MKQAEQGVHGAINTCATRRTQRRRSKTVSATGADELIVQAVVSQPAEVERLYRRVRDDSGVWWPMATR
jgi:hypothetical protein